MNNASVINGHTKRLPAVTREGSCFKNRRVTSVSAMVFMIDSERAAEISLRNGIDTGLHLNFSQLFNGKNYGKQIVRSNAIAFAWLHERPSSSQ